MHKLSELHRYRIIMPVLEFTKTSEDREIIEIFLQRHRDIEAMRPEARILNAIEKTAMLTGNSDGVIAKILVDHGLRSSRKSLPQEFLDYIDTISLRSGEKMFSVLSSAMEDIRDFWIEEGEGTFSFLYSTGYERTVPSFQTV